MASSSFVPHLSLLLFLFPLSLQSPRYFPFSLTFASLADDGLSLSLGGEQALDAVLSGADLHRKKRTKKGFLMGFDALLLFRSTTGRQKDSRLLFLRWRERSCSDGDDALRRRRERSDE